METLEMNFGFIGVIIIGVGRFCNINFNAGVNV